MLVTLTLGGHGASWRLEDSTNLATWLSRRPWLHEGGVRALRTASAMAREVHVAVLREILASDAGTSGLQVHELWEEDAKLPPHVAAQRCLLGGDDRPERVVADDLGREAAGGTIVLMLSAFGVADLAPRLEAWQRFLEMILKLGHSRAPVLLVFHDDASLDGPLAMRMDVGRPLDVIEQDVIGADTAAKAWRAYLHARITWEVHGALPLATALDQSLPADLAVGDDDALESAFHAHACASFSELPPEIRLEWQKHVAACIAGALTRRPDSRPVTDGFAPPWVVRALLTNGVTPTWYPLLRSLLCCRPLAEQILTRLFDHEARVRAHHPRPSQQPPDTAARYFERYRNRPDYVTRRLYPPAHPLPPDHAWDFASLGEVMRALQDDGEVVPQGVYQLMDLRNALAHGHNAGWQALQALREIEIALAAVGATRSGPRLTTGVSRLARP